MKYFFIIMVFGLAGCSAKNAQLTSADIADMAKIVDLIDWEQVEALEDTQAEGLRVPPSGGRDCSKDGKPARTTTVDTAYYSTFKVTTHRNTAGYWHNSKNAYAKVYTYLDTGIDFNYSSYDNQNSTDVVNKKVRYPASMRLYDNGMLRIVHKRNRYETDIPKKGRSPALPAVTWIDTATGDTICIGSYTCDWHNSGCSYFPFPE